jgi:hypothetical protein
MVEDGLEADDNPGDAPSAGRGSADGGGNTVGVAVAGDDDGVANEKSGAVGGRDVVFPGGSVVRRTTRVAHGLKPGRSVRVCHVSCSFASRARA